MRSEISLDVAIARKTSRERLVLCQKRRSNARYAQSHPCRNDTYFIIHV